MKAGDRVKTLLGPGTIVYQRMGPPTYAQAVAFSVHLDWKAHQANYTATIFSAADVRPACDCPECACGTGHQACDCLSPYYPAPTCVGAISEGEP